MAKQNRLLDTKTVRLNKLGLNVRYTELGGSTHPLVLLLHGVPESLVGPPCFRILMVLQLPCPTNTQLLKTGQSFRPLPPLLPTCLRLQPRLERQRSVVRRG